MPIHALFCLVQLLDLVVVSHFVDPDPGKGFPQARFGVRIGGVRTVFETGYHQNWM